MSIRFRHLVLPLILTGLAFTAAGAQDTTLTVSGTVYESENGKPLPGVNVYLAETTDGGSTDADGRFSFTTEHRGRFQLIISMTGYERHTQAVTLTGEDLNVEADLSSRTYKMDALQVSGSNREWKENLAIFKREFIGTGQLARQTEILNPLILDFERDPRNGDITASAPKPLVVVNRAMGYRIYLVLDAFHFDNRGQYGFFRIYPKFTELEAPNPETRRRWERNRERVYTGSRQHFLRSLYEGRVSQRGFDVRSMHDLVPMSRKEIEFAMLGREGVSEELVEDLKGFRLHREIEIIYGLKTGYLSTRGGDTFSVIRSMMFPETPQKHFFIDPNGNLLDPSSISIQGDWYANRLAHRLPMEYER